MPVNKEDIYRKALLSLNISYERIKGNEGSLEIEYCKEYLPSAVAYCSTLRPWYWLMKTEEYSIGDEDTSETFKGMGYSYDAPKDMAYICFVDGKYNEEYAMRGNTIFFNKPILTLDYMTNAEFDEYTKASDGTVTYTKKGWKCPEPYANLIATRLAIEIAPFIAPDTAIEQRCMAQHNLTLQTLIKLDIDGSRKRNPDPKEFVE